MSEERLARIEAQQVETITLVRSLAEKVEDQIGQVDLWRTRIEKTLYGDNGTRGMIVQVALLNASYKRQQMTSRILLGAIVPLLAGVFWGLIVE